MDTISSALSGDRHSLQETARLILSTATSDSSSVSVNYLIPLLLLASLSTIRTFVRTKTFISVPLGYFVFRLGLFNLDDSLGSSAYGAPSAGYGAPQASYGAPAPSYSAPAPAPSYNAPAPSYNAPAPSYSAPTPSYNSQSPSSGLVIPNSGAYLTSKEDDQVRCWSRNI